MEKRKLNLLMDFYEVTMAYGYFLDNRHEEEAVFDVFFRKIPESGGYAVFAGLEQIIDYLENLKFAADEIEVLRKKKIFSEPFLNYLANFELKLDIFAMKEGTPIFPQEPILIAKGPIIQCQLIETMVLLTINHQSLIATKASRIVREANGRVVMEFGARRAHGYDAANFGARAAYIAGVLGTSNTYAEYAFGIPALGTMAHSYIQSFPTEYEAFESFARAFPKNVSLLVDTYDTLKQGIPNAIKLHKEILLPNGNYLNSIRIDSGDLTYLSKKARKMLDDAGLTNTKIIVSNSLDEYLINDLLNQGAKIDIFGVGERLITARSEAVFGGVFKLSAINENGELVPKIKLSENVSKTTTPAFKQVHRFYDQDDKAIADVITLHDEAIDGSHEYVLFHPDYTYKKKKVINFKPVKLLVPIFEKGKLVYQKPSLTEIRTYHQEQLNTLWDEMKRLSQPHQYYVDLSQKLWDIKQELMVKYKNGN